MFGPKSLVFRRSMQRDTAQELIVGARLEKEIRENMGLSITDALHMVRNPSVCLFVCSCVVCVCACICVFVCLRMCVRVFFVGCTYSFAASAGRKIQFDRFCRDEKDSFAGSAWIYQLILYALYFLNKQCQNLGMGLDFLSFRERN